MSTLAAHITSLAGSVQGKQQWPGWSTGETLMVALVLNDADVLRSMGYTIVEALDRVELSASKLREIERELQP